jgi:hypothetical protein
MSLDQVCGGRTCRTRVPIRTAVTPARRGRPRDLTPILGFTPTRITKPHALGSHLESDTSQVELCDENEVSSYTIAITE